MAEDRHRLDRLHRELEPLVRPCVHHKHGEAIVDAVPEQRDRDSVVFAVVELSQVLRCVTLMPIGALL
jgi:hypothetical protein